MNPNEQNPLPTPRKTCPHLPEGTEPLTWRALNQFGSRRDADFYLAALTYAQDLWRRGLSARALLAVDRALFADLRGNEPVLHDWPMPYPAVPWMILHNPPGIFIGNPRVHYQHLADRVRNERADQKKWRAWACWALVRTVAPDLPADPKHKVTEPTESQIQSGLQNHGLPGEVELWQKTLLAIQPETGNPD